MKRRRIALVMAAAMVLTSLPTTTWAGEDFSAGEAVIEESFAGEEVTEEVFEDVQAPEETVEMFTEDATDEEIFQEETTSEETEDMELFSAGEDAEAEETELFSAGEGEEDSLPEAEELAVGGSYKVSVGEEESKYFKFLPSETGKYRIYSSDNSADPHVTLYEESEGELNYLASNDDGSGMGTNFSLYYQLDAGKTYYYQVRELDNESLSCNVHFEKAPVVTGLTFVNEKEYYLAGFSGDFGNGIYAVLTYSDDTSDEVKYGFSGKYGDYVYYTMYKDSTKQESVSIYDAPAGSYYLEGCVYNGEGTQLTGGLQVAVKTIWDEASGKVLPLNGSLELKGRSDTYTCLMFTADTAGDYVFRSDAALNESVLVHEKDGEQYPSDSDWGDNYGYYSFTSNNLKAGEAYAVILRTVADDVDFTLSVQKVDQEAEAQKGKINRVNISPSASTKIAGMDIIDTEDFRIKLEYADGSNRWTYLDDSDSYGNSFEEEVTDANGSVVDRAVYRSASAITPGKYYVKAVYRTSNGIAVNSGIVSENQAEVNFLNPLDIAQEIPENQEIKLKASSERQFFKFTPSKQQAYSFIARNRNVWTNLMYLTDSGWNYASWSDLEAGKTYLLVVDSCVRSQYVKIMGEEDYPALTLNTPAEMNGGEYYAHQFIPEKDGWYEVIGEGLTEGNMDRAYISVSNYLEETEGGLGKRVVKMQQGIRHKIYVSGSAEESYKITVKETTEPIKNEIKTVKDFSVAISKKPEGYPVVFASEYDYTEFLSITASYSDGSTETISGDQYDSRGQRFDAYEDGMILSEGDSAIYRIQVYFGGIEKTIELAFAKEVSGLPVLTENTSVSEEEKWKFYRFTPDATGYYMVNSNAEEIYWAVDGDNDSWGIGERRYLEKNVPYIIGVRGWWRGNVPRKITLELTKAKQVKRLKVLTPAASYYAECDTPGQGMSVEISYTDGSTAVVSYGEEMDGNGNEISWYSGTRSSGKTRVYMECGDRRVYSEAAENKLGDLLQVKMTGVTEIPANTQSVAVTPKEDGTYGLYGVGKEYAGSFGLFDPATGKTTYDMPIDLEAGHTYVLIINNGNAPGYIIAYRADGNCKGKHDMLTVTVGNDCTASRYTVSICRNCGIFRWKNLAATGHKYGSWKVTKAATVFAAGLQKRICSECKHEETKTINKLTPTMTVNAKTLPLKTKQTTTKLKVTGLANGDSVKSWKSSKTSVVKVTGKANGTCKITAQNKTGKANITITLASGKTATVAVTVKKSTVKTTKISGLKSRMTLQKGKTATLSPVITPISSVDKTTFSSSNKKVVAVSSKGKMKALKAGTAKITVKSGSKKFVVKVTVPKTKTTAIKINKTVLPLKKGKTFTLKTKLTPSNSDEKITYTSSNKKVATVSSKGKIKGVKKGTATITVKSGSKKATCKVTVK